MSRAFIKESDDQWLHEVAPTMSALIAYLTRENNGIMVRERRRYADATGREIFEMSNGLSYAKDTNGIWRVVED
jgi:hypothetical protein